MKVGAGVASARLESYAAVWFGSVLRVEKVDGSVERWKTRYIVNFSKYGKAFNQFPTRKLK